MAATEAKFQDIWELVEGHLDLRSRALNDDDLKELAAILKNDETVISIALGENDFSSEGAKTIIEALNTTMVTEISFHNNQLSNIKIIS